MNHYDSKWSYADQQVVHKAKFPFNHNARGEQRDAYGLICQNWNSNNFDERVPSRMIYVAAGMS